MSAWSSFTGLKRLAALHIAQPLLRITFAYNTRVIAVTSRCAPASQGFFLPVDGWLMMVGALSAHEIFERNTISSRHNRCKDAHSIYRGTETSKFHASGVVPLVQRNDELSSLPSASAYFINFLFGKCKEVVTHHSRGHGSRKNNDTQYVCVRQYCLLWRKLAAVNTSL
jgi:hypothetical protein